MSKTTALRAVLTAKLQTICPRVYYGQADKETARPYLVYTLEQLSQEDDLHQMELEINVTDYGIDTTPAETIADGIMAAFDKWYYIDDEIQFAAYPDRCQPVTEDDRLVIRRRLLIEIHFYERR